MPNEEQNSCYKCCWSTDKCKNKDSNMYDVFVEDIKECNIVGAVDNSKEMHYQLYPEC